MLVAATEGCPLLRRPACQVDFRTPKLVEGLALQWWWVLELSRKIGAPRYAKRSSDVIHDICKFNPFCALALAEVLRQAMSHNQAKVATGQVGIGFVLQTITHWASLRAPCSGSSGNSRCSNYRFAVGEVSSTCTGAAQLSVAVLCFRATCRKLASTRVRDKNRLCTGKPSREMSVCMQIRRVPKEELEVFFGLPPTLHIAAQNFKSEGFNCASRSNCKIFKPSILKPEMQSTKAQAQKASSAISQLLLGQSRKLEAPMPLTLDRPRRMLVVMDVSEVSCVWRVSGRFFRKLPKVETP